MSGRNDPRALMAISNPIPAYCPKTTCLVVKISDDDDDDDDDDELSLSLLLHVIVPFPVPSRTTTGLTLL